MALAASGYAHGDSEEAPTVLTVLVIVLVAAVLLVAATMYGGVGPRRVRRRVVVERPAGRVADDPVARVVEEPASEVVEERTSRVVSEPGADQPYVEERVVRRPVTRTRRTRRVVD